MVPGQSFIVAVLAATAALTLTVHEASAQVVVFVSVGEPTKETVRLLAPYLDEMSHHPSTVASPLDVRSHLGNRMPRPGRADPGLRVSDLVMRYEAGLAHFKKNQWKEARDKLDAAVAMTHDNPALLVDETSHRDTWMKGQIALAMSKVRLHDTTGADATNEDLARTYPNQESTVRGLSGTEAGNNYGSAQGRLEARGRGRLIVDVKEQAALVYLDEGDRPQNGLLEVDALPGPHRVLARLPGTDGQLYEALVEPNKVTHISIDLNFGEALTVTERYAGFVFQTAADRQRYAVDYAAQLAALVDAGPEMVIVERTTWDGRPAFASTVYLADSGAWVRGRVAMLDGRNDDDKMRALARETLRGQKEDQHIVDVPDPALESYGASGHGWLKWGAAGSASLALAGGATLLYLHSTCGADLDPCHNSSPRTAYFMLGTGLAMGAVATYLFLSEPRGAHPPQLSLQATARGAVVGVLLRY